MAYESRAYAYVTIFGAEFEPEQLTASVGLMPTQTGRRGEAGRYAPYKETFWEYRLPETDALEGLDAALNQLCEVLLPKTAALRVFMQQHGLRAKCDVVISVRQQENAGLRISATFATLLHELSATLEVDMYNG